MLKKSTVIIFFVLLGAVFSIAYFQLRIPLGVTPQSDQGELLAWVALATSIASLVTALIGFIQKLLELKRSNLE